MYRISIKNAKNANEYEELIKTFLRPDEFVLTDDEADFVFDILESDKSQKNASKREIYQALSALTAQRPPWGILTGIRPVKLAGELLGTLDRKAVYNKLTQEYLLSQEKAELAIGIFESQLKTVGLPPANSAGLYIGIPFCPTRCLYCSFASNQVKYEKIKWYLEALEREMRAVSRLMKEKGITAETIYIGGGTPTSLNEEDLENLLKLTNELFAHEGLKEFSVEAGRPDTLNFEKLKIMHDAGVDRISINPQSMKNDTLEKIGRCHTREDIIEAVKLAKEVGFKTINMDVIAGLPDETLEDFEKTLDEIIGLGANNITVHSLAVKRASRLVEIDKDYHYKHGELVSEMLELAKEKLNALAYWPYYLYRQKHMSGAQENTAYSQKGHENVYNIRIMDEHQHILAMGAGGISKVYYPEENRLERVPNVTNYEIYVERIEEMIRRKENAY